MVAFLPGGSPRDLARALRRMGVRMEELDAERVVVELRDGRVLEVNPPAAVMVLRVKGQPPMLYVIGEPREVEAKPAEEEAGEAGGVEVSEEDVMLVAEQAGVSPEEARRALIEAGGDIAAAILKLKGEEA